MWTGEGESKVLYVHTHGVDDPSRCATPFFLAASAADLARSAGAICKTSRSAFQRISVPVL